MKITKYVLGFLFSPDKKSVALIRKNRPEWQKGLLNGIGGHIEDGESPLIAMCRESREEIGLSILDWVLKIEYRDKDFQLFIFTAFSDKILEVKTMTDEEVFLIGTNKLAEAIPNLKWFIPLLLDPEVQMAEIKGNNILEELYPDVSEQQMRVTINDLTLIDDGRIGDTVVECYGQIFKYSPRDTEEYRDEEGNLVDKNKFLEAVLEDVLEAFNGPKL